MPGSLSGLGLEEKCVSRRAVVSAVSFVTNQSGLGAVCVSPRQDSSFDGMDHHAHFDLDIPRAIYKQLVKAFDKLVPEPLSSLTVTEVPKAMGVYGLIYDGALVYVGNAKNLRKRFLDHRTKIGGRENITAAEVGFQCLSVNPNWSAYAPEAILIAALDPAWNGSGFGNHDPGRNREQTDKPPDGFDSQFPIRLNWPCTHLQAGTYSALELARSLKAELPYLLRYGTSSGRTWRTGHADFDGVTVTLPQSGMAASDVLRALSAALPGWQATAFVSHVIFYKESRTYAHGTVL